MKRMCTALLLVPVMSWSVSAGDWPAWRGPTGNGIAEAGQQLPHRWTETDRVIWKSPVPGRGHSSPTVVGKRLFLTTARESEGKQSVLCYHRDTGKVLWETTVLEGRLPEKIHAKNTHASPTVACDGERLFTVFLAGDDVVLVALDVEGRELWRKVTGQYKWQYPFGYGASPLIVGALVVVVCDVPETGYLVAYDRVSGREVWRTPRPSKGSSWSSPILGEIAGKSTILLCGSERVAGYDPETGRELYSVSGGPLATAGTVVCVDGVVYASGGFPTKHTWATDLKAGKVLWEQPVSCYEQSLLVVGGHVYAVTENGFAQCWSANEGVLQWKQRIAVAAESASPVLADGVIYFANEKGTITLFRPHPARYEEVAVNQLGNEIFATPTICGNRIYIRAALREGGTRQETLYAIGKQ